MSGYSSAGMNDPEASDADFLDRQAKESEVWDRWGVAERFRRIAQGLRSGSTVYLLTAEGPNERPEFIGVFSSEDLAKQEAESVYMDSMGLEWKERKDGVHWTPGHDDGSTIYYVRPFTLDMAR